MSRELRALGHASINSVAVAVLNDNASKLLSMNTLIKPNYSTLQEHFFDASLPCHT